MNNIRKCLLGMSILIAVSPAAAQDPRSRASDLGSLVQSWQPRLIAAGMTADDAKSWTVRNMGRFARLNDERLALARKAGSLDELELALMDPPLGAGTPLGVVMANPLGGLTMMGARNATKSSPASSPSAYAGMVFTALNPCRILDTRPSQGGTGAWAAATSNLIKIGPYSTAGGGYQTGAGAQGGSATSCGLDALAGPGQVAVIMAAVSTVAQAGPGYLTFYPQGSPNPGLTSVSQWFQPGYVQTSFVLIPSDLSGTVAALGYTSVATDVIIDVVGYFAPEPSEAAVTSITAGTGLTGGTITSTGTIGLAATNLLPTVACTTNQIAKWNGSAWACAADANSGGTVTGVTASAPLASTGGTAPNVSLTGVISVANGGTGQSTLASNGVVYGQGTSGVATAVGTTGDVLTGSAGAPTWTGSPSISGNLTLTGGSTAGAGNIMKGTNSFLHNFGLSNTFAGLGAGNFTMTGLGNSGFGESALTANTTGNQNTAHGVSALSSNTTGLRNTATGTSALLFNVDGNQNVAAGYAALALNTSGSFNTALGASALGSGTTGNFNIAVGANAGSAVTTGSSNIHIGNDGVAGDDAIMRIGGGQLKTFIAGIRGRTTGANDAVAVVIDSNGQLGTVSSSRRFKDGIADMDDASSALMTLRPVTFHYKSDASSRRQYGLIAEEVAEVYPDLVARSADGQVETVMYQFLAPMLLNEVQKLQRTVESQRLVIRKLEETAAEIEGLKAAVARLLDRPEGRVATR